MGRRKFASIGVYEAWSIHLIERETPAWGLGTRDW